MNSDLCTWKKWARAGLLTVLAAGAAAQPSQTPQRTVVGITTALSGANSAYGQGLVHGVRLGLARSGSPGGADGRPVELEVLDDKSDPAVALANVRKLVGAGAVALTALHGNRSVEAVRPVLAQSGVPLVGAASSADSLRSPADRQIFNLRAGASDEIAAIVSHLDTIGMNQIAALAVEDGLGASGLEGLNVELVRLAMRPVAMASVATLAPKEDTLAALKKLCAAAPQAVLLAVDAARALTVLQEAGAAGCAASTRFVAVSETGSAIELQGGGTQARGLLVSQVLPHPSQLAHPLAAAYQRALAGDTAAASYASLEGYLYGRVIGEALRLCARKTTPACVTEMVETRITEVDGWRLRFGRGERSGSRYVDLTLLGPQGRVRR